MAAMLRRAWHTGKPRSIHAVSSERRIQQEPSGAILSNVEWVCDLGQPRQEQHHIRDYLDHQATSTKRTAVCASFEDLVFIMSGPHAYVLGTSRPPSPWKTLTAGKRMIFHLCASRLPGSGGSQDSELLLVAVNDKRATLRFCPRRRRFPSSESDQAAPQVPVSRAVWFQGAFYVRCRPWESKFKFDEDPDTFEEPEYEPEAVVYSLMRFEVEGTRWEELEMSQRDRDILNSGEFYLLLLQGRMLVFLLPAPYLEARGCSLVNEGLWPEVEASVIGDGKSPKVFQVVDRDEESGPRTRKMLVDVSGEFEKALGMAAEQNATNFFNSDADDESGVFFWVTSGGRLTCFSMLSNEVIVEDRKLWPAPRRSFEYHSRDTFHDRLFYHHTGLTPPGVESFTETFFY